jgi:hypothetical protein
VDAAQTLWESAPASGSALYWPTSNPPADKPDSNSNQVENGKVGECQKLHPVGMQIGDESPGHQSREQLNDDNDLEIVADPFNLHQCITCFLQ